MKRTVRFALLIFLVALRTAARDHGINLNPQNTVNDASKGVTINDYGRGAVWTAFDVLSQFFPSVNFSRADIQKVTGVAVKGKTGVINWGNFNIDPGTTMLVGTAEDDKLSHTLYNIVSGGNATTIAGSILDSSNGAGLGVQGIQWIKNNITDIVNNLPGGKKIGELLDANPIYFNRNVNVWVINPAGISISSGASVNLNGYLGLCAGAQLGSVSDSAEIFTTRAYNSGSIDVQGSITASSLVLLGNDVSVGNVNVPTFIGSGEGIEVGYESLRVNSLSLPQDIGGTLDGLKVRGSFRERLQILAAGSISLSDINAVGRAEVNSRAGGIDFAGDTKFYGNVELLANAGSITLSGGSFGAERAVKAVAHEDIAMNAAENRFLGSVEMEAKQGSIALGGKDLTRNLTLKAASEVTLQTYGDYSDLALDAAARISVGEEGRLNLTSSRNIAVGSDLGGWNGRLGKVEARNGTVAIAANGPLTLGGDVNGKSVALSGALIETDRRLETMGISAAEGNVDLRSTGGIVLTSGGQISALKGAVNFENEGAGEVVLGQPRTESDRHLEITGANVAITQKADADLAVEETASVYSTSKVESDPGLVISHAGDLYVFGDIKQDKPDPAKGYNDDGSPKGYLLPTIKSIGNGEVRAMSLNMRKRDYALSELGGLFGTWDNLEYMRLSEIGEHFAVDQNLTLKTAEAGSRTGNRSSVVLEGAGDLTVTIGKGLIVDADRTGLRLAAGAGKELHLAGDGRLRARGDKALTFGGGLLTADPALGIEARKLAFTDEIDVRLSGGNVLADEISGRAGDFALRAGALADSGTFRLSDDFSAFAVTLDTGLSPSERRDFDGSAGNFNADSIRMGVREGATVKLRSAQDVKLGGIPEGDDTEGFTTIANLVYDTPKGFRLEANRNADGLTVTDASAEKHDGELYFREEAGSMHIATAVRTKGDASFVAGGDGATLRFTMKDAEGKEVEAVNDVDGELKVVAKDQDIRFVNRNRLTVGAVIAKDATFVSQNDDIVVLPTAGEDSPAGAHVSGTLTLDAEKGNVTVGLQGGAASDWSGRLGPVRAQGTVAVATERKLLLDGDIVAGDIILAGGDGIVAEGDRIVSATDQTKRPHDELMRNNTGHLTATSARGAVELWNEDGRANDVVSVSGEATEGFRFLNGRSVEVGDVTVAADGREAAVRSRIGDVKVSGRLAASKVRLHAAEEIAFGERAVIAAGEETELVADNADINLDLTDAASTEARKSWHLGRISATAGVQDYRKDVTIKGLVDQVVEVGTIRARNVNVSGEKGVLGGGDSLVQADGTAAFAAAEGDVRLLGENTFRGVVTANAPNGNVEINSADLMTVGDITANGEHGEITLRGATVESGAGSPVELAAARVNLEATEELDFEFLHGANLNRVAAPIARLDATADPEASLSVAEGEIGHLVARSSTSIDVKNAQDLTIDGLSAGGDVALEVAGSLTQGGVTADNRIEIGGVAKLAATDDIRLDNPYNSFGEAISAEAGYAVGVSADTDLAFDRLTGVDVRLESVHGGITVKDGTMDMLAADAEGKLTVANSKGLELGRVKASAIELAAAGDLTGDRRIETDADGINVLVADGAISLTGEDNLMGPKVAVLAAGPVSLVNNRSLDVRSEEALDIGTIRVKGANSDVAIAAPKLTQSGQAVTVDSRGVVDASRLTAGVVSEQGSVALAAETIGTKEQLVAVRTGKSADVIATEDAAVARLGDWTIGGEGKNGGDLSVGGNLKLVVDGTLATAGSGALAAGGNIDVAAAGYAPQVAMALGGKNLDVKRTAGSTSPQWALFKTRGGNRHPHLGIYPNDVWVVIDGRLTPTQPDYPWIMGLEAANICAMDALNPVSTVFGRPYLLAEADVGSIDLVGLGRYPYLGRPLNAIDYEHKEEEE